MGMKSDSITYRSKSMLLTVVMFCTRLLAKKAKLSSNSSSMLNPFIMVMMSSSRWF